MDIGKSLLLKAAFGELIVGGVAALCILFLTRSIIIAMYTASAGCLIASVTIYIAYYKYVELNASMSNQHTKKMQKVSIALFIASVFALTFTFFLEKFISSL